MPDAYDEALDPGTFRDLYTAALAPFWDTSRYEAVVAAEERDREQLGAP